MGIEARQWTGMPMALAGDASRLPRQGPRGAERSPSPSGLPVEIAFLAAQGAAPDILLRASAVARQTGVSADRALLGEGFAADRFYALLARHLGVPFVDEPMRLALPPGRSLEGIAAGIVPLAPNTRRLDLLLAPQGSGLAALLRHAPPGRGQTMRFGITSRRRLEAMVRRRDAATVAEEASHGLGGWDATLSAQAGLRPGQGVTLAVLFALFGAGLICYPAATFVTGMFAVSLLFFAAVLLRLVATAANVAPTPCHDRPLPDHELPLYTVIIPLYREAAVVPQLIAALDRLDYPRAKLDIKLMIEADDPETLAALEALRLPDHYDIIVGPPGWPQTKPRALNIGLHYARGDLIVVYDAEDVPDPSQLRAAAARFQARPSSVACLQARLLIDHLETNWLSLGIMAQVPQASTRLRGRFKKVVRGKCRVAGCMGSGVRYRSHPSRAQHRGRSGCPFLSRAAGHRPQAFDGSCGKSSQWRSSDRIARFCKNRNL